MRLPVALVQLDATGDVDANIDRATALADEAAAGGARLVVLPEYLQFRGDDAGFRARRGRSPDRSPTPSPMSPGDAASGSWPAASPRPSMTPRGPATRAC